MGKWLAGSSSVDTGSDTAAAKSYTSIQALAKEMTPALQPIKVVGWDKVTNRMTYGVTTSGDDRVSGLSVSSAIAGDDIKVVNGGQIEDINTMNYEIFDSLYVGSDGVLTSVIPETTYRYMGSVKKKHFETGIILVDIGPVIDPSQTGETTIVENTEIVQTNTIRTVLAEEKTLVLQGDNDSLLKSPGTLPWWWNSTNSSANINTHMSMDAAGVITVHRAGRINIDVNLLIAHELQYIDDGTTSDSSAEYSGEFSHAEIEIRLNGYNQRSIWSQSTGAQRYHSISKNISIVVEVGDIIDFYGRTLSEDAYIYFRRGVVHNGAILTWKELV